MVSKKRKGKGLKRSAKQWGNSLSDHIGRILDNSSVKDIAELSANIIVSIAGARAVSKFTDDLQAQMGGAASGVIALKLAMSPNLVAGASGTAYLASLGLINVYNPGLGEAVENIKGFFDPLEWLKAKKWKPIFFTPEEKGFLRV